MKYPKFLIFPLQMYRQCHPGSISGSGGVDRRAGASPCLWHQLIRYMAVSPQGLLSSLLCAPYSERQVCNYFAFQLSVLLCTCPPYAHPTQDAQREHPAPGQEVVEPPSFNLNWARSWRSWSHLEAQPALSWKWTSRSPFRPQLFYASCREMFKTDVQRSQWGHH